MGWTMSGCQFSVVIFRSLLTGVLWSISSGQLSGLSQTSSLSAGRVGPPDSRCNINNGLVADASDCRGYLLCLQGAARQLHCTRDLLFNQLKLVCDFPSNVQCGNRPLVSGSPSSSWSSNSVPESGRCYTAVVNVTIDIKNDVRAPQFYESVTLRVQRQPLRHVLLIAAGMDPKFRFETTEFPGFGDHLSSIYGVRNDIQAIWTLFDKRGSLVRENLDEFYPENGEILTFVFSSTSV
ncbi:uncharacterized protein LOC112577238 [Pomacea canaliculata]|uniref:uncharacterized protein LOC112577238 n=1 Tax=Pomacea canaliculata TaxID=400727 RepID=UPI000D7358F1|nr:uncharacterized protein LOC112577238 [Pomacea canaliculata]XP_025116056.1 uncharacterized protein LOC112577238 [Pomacea canaliculata]XP_025116057.1 uncharacterized protein LOC112577238 [Pomacea canaliculata]